MAGSPPVSGTYSGTAPAWTGSQWISGPSHRIERTYHRWRRQRRLGKLALIGYETINQAALTVA